MPELYELSAAEAVAAISRGTLSPVELVEALLKRIGSLDVGLGAWERIDGEGALAAARESERRLAHAQPRALEGLPVGLKDIFYTADLRTSAGFAPFENFVPDHDAGAVTRLREAGAVLLGKTVTTQFAFMDPARTRNPWNVQHTPGGSSSGSGAAVAARMTPAALGTQTAGSVLRPAVYCGVVGFKPTFGRISRFGVIPLSWSLDHVGVITRTVEDAALLFQALMGHDARDPASVAGREEDIVSALKRESPAPRLGLVTDFLERAQPEVRAHVNQTARRLEQAGAQVRPLALPQAMNMVLAVHRVIMQTEAAEVHARLHAQYPEDYGPGLRAYVEVGELIPGAAYVHAQRLRHRIRKELAGLLDGLDALLTPTASNTAPDLSTTGDPSFQGVWTLVGFPSITVPSGLSSAGLPFGIQLVARPFADARLLAAARWCQDVMGPMPAPSLPGP